jgi:hypothetical protein
MPVAAASILVSCVSEDTHSSKLNVESNVIDEASSTDVVEQTPLVEDTEEPVAVADDLASQDEGDSAAHSAVSKGNLGVYITEISFERARRSHQDHLPCERGRHVNTACLLNNCGDYSLALGICAIICVMPAC